MQSHWQCPSKRRRYFVVSFVVSLTVTVSSTPDSVGETRRRQEERESRGEEAAFLVDNCVPSSCSLPFISIGSYLGKYNLRPCTLAVLWTKNPWLCLGLFIAAKCVKSQNHPPFYTMNMIVLIFKSVHSHKVNMPSLGEVLGKSWGNHGGIHRG